MKMSDGLLARLEKVRARYAELGELLSRPEVISDQGTFRAYSKEMSDLAPAAEKYDVYLGHKREEEECSALLQGEQDPEMREMLKEELEGLRKALDDDAAELRVALLPKDPDEDNNVIMEIRAGAGGDEAALFGTELMKMYRHYADSKRWKVEEINMNYTELGGAKELTFMITGKGAWGNLKFESGVHRVQRVPQTETQGRVHTSAASVAVLPEAEEFDVEISMNDIRKDIFCASGPGGQSVNTTYSAIRLTHIPTGIVVQCQDQKSQLKNFDKAFEELRTRVFNLEYSKYLDEIASKRKTMVSTGDRSAKIRTYNYPQGRITDHRINYTIYNLSAFMDGDIQDVIDHLIVAENAERLKESEL